MRVEGPSGERWELALTLLADGTAGVEVGNVSIGRRVGYPTADGRLTVSVVSAWSDPVYITEEIARAEVQSGIATVERLREVDPRLDAMFREHGAEWDYICDYGKSAVRVAEVREDGHVRWERPPSPGGA